MGRRLSPSLVISCIALFVALGGVGYAAVELPRNSVGELQLQRGAVGTEELQYGAVNSRKILDGSVHAADLAPGLLAGQQGAKGEKGDAGASSAGAGGGSGLTLRAADGTELGTFLGLLDNVPTYAVAYHGGIYEYLGFRGELMQSTGADVYWADAACSGTPYHYGSSNDVPALNILEVKAVGGARRYISYGVGAADRITGYQSTGRSAHPDGSKYWVDYSGVCTDQGPFDVGVTWVELEPAPTPPSPAPLPFTIG